MKKCKKCQTDIDDKATKCPHCQSDQRNWFRRHPIWTFFILCFTVPPVLSGFFSSQENINKQLQTPTPTPNAEQVKQNLEDQKEWEKSKAGQICTKHPEWTKEECQNLVDNRIWIGMTYDMLIVQRGKPNSANPSNYGNGTRWQWCWHDYKPSCFYDNNDDGITDSYN